MASVVDDAVQSASLSALVSEGAAASSRRLEGADAFAESNRYSWNIAMQSPTIFASHGMRIAAETGSGRTRLEANRPAETSAAAPIGS